MKLSAPIHVLKSKAKKLKLEHSITMVEALNEVAKSEGLASWSLLQAKSEDIFPGSFKEVLPFFNPGDMILVGARPGMGKTSFAIGLFVEAINQNKPKHFFFSLSEVHRDIETRMTNYDSSTREKRQSYLCDYSEMICADYIIEKTDGLVGPGSLIIIDYLQLLDQRRSTPEIKEQLSALKNFAIKSRAIILFISQVDRTLELKQDRRPTTNDIRVVNELDIKVFNKILFLYHDESDPSKAEVLFRRPNDFSFKINRDNKRAVYF